MWPILVLFVSGLSAILILAHWLVYLTATYFLHFKNLWLQWFFLLVPLGFIVSSFIGLKFHNSLTKLFYCLSSAWLGLFNFLLISTILLWLLWLLNRLLHWPLPFNILTIICLVLSVAAFIYGFINANYLRVKEYSVSLPNLNEVWLGRQAVWISDLHLGQIRGAKFCSSVVDKVNALEPDIVFIGGDLFDGSAADLDALAAPLAKMKAPLGIYFITGNHEEYNKSNDYLKAVSDLGIKILADQATTIDDLIIIGVNFRDGSSYNRLKKTLALVGVNIHGGSGEERFQKAFADLDKAQPMILLNHYPGNLELAYQSAVNLQISGHSHQGQIWPYNYITKLLYHGYDEGLKKYKDMTVITSAGAGTWGPPLRIAANPDIIKINFVKE